MSVPSNSWERESRVALIGLDPGWSDPERAKAKKGKLPSSYARALPTKTAPHFRLHATVPPPRSHAKRALGVSSSWGTSDCKKLELRGCKPGERRTLRPRRWELEPGFQKRKRDGHPVWPQGQRKRTPEH